jgi:hypothetical protein
MGGIFTKSARPLLAGSYFDFLVSQPPVVSPSVGRIVACCITHTWGPLETPTICFTLSEFLQRFGGDPNDPSPGYKAVRQCFQGEGTPDFGGAGAVIVYRMGSDDAAKAELTLSNTTPTAAITVSAKHEGTDGNFLGITTQDHAADPLKAELIVLTGTTVLETYVYDDTDLQGLVDSINAASSWITATLTIDGVKLAPVTDSALTGGDDGNTLIAQDYTDTFTALDVQRFGVLVFENLTDQAIITSAKAWTQGKNEAGKRFFLVLGGELDEDIGDAIARSADLNDPDILNVGVGSVRDNLLPDANGNPTVLSTAELAPRIAGVMAARGERYSLTFAKLAGLELIAGPSAAGIRQAYDGGVIVLDRASDAQATVRIAKGLTTFIDTADGARPRKIFSTPRFVAAMHGIQEDLVHWSDENVIGKATVDDNSRAAVIGQINTFMRQREEIGAVQPGWDVMVDPSPPAADPDDFMAFVIAAKFGRSAEQVFFVAQMA